MSLEETAKLLSESRIIVDQGKESNDVAYLLNLILNVVTNVDNGVQKIENKLSKLDGVQAEVNAISLPTWSTRTSTSRNANQIC
jgi:translation elongation factor EF-1beta